MTSNRTGVYRRRSDAGLLDKSSQFYFKENTPAGVGLGDESGFVVANLPTATEMLSETAEFGIVSDLYDVEALPTHVIDGWAELGVLDHFGDHIHITTEPGGDGTIEPAAEHFQVWSGQTAAEFWREDGTPLSNTWVEYAARKAYDEALLEKLDTMLGQDKNGDTAILKEIAHIKGREMYRSGLTQPDGWEGEYPLTKASTLIGHRLQGGDTANADPINARADYAEVTEDGVAYGLTIHVNFFGEILGGQRDDEDEMDYAERIAEAFDSAKVAEFFSQEYGADVMNAGDYGDIGIEFFVKYGVEGAAGTSIEAMGDRVEKETKLLDALNAYSYGAGMTNRFAEFFGYRSESTFDEHGWAGAKWVKDIETLETLV